MAEIADAVEKATCPTCAAPSPLEQVGSASGRKHYRCPKCGPWREKNAAACVLGSLGGKAAAASLSPQARSQRASDAATARWTAEKLKKNVK